MRSDILQPPVWDARVEPTVQLASLSLDGQHYTETFRLHHGVSEGLSGELLAWVNGWREPVLNEICGTGRYMVTEGLAARDIHANEVAEVVADITGAPPFPRQRILANGPAMQADVYRNAVAALTPGLAFDRGDDINAQYNPLLSVCAVNDGILAEAGRARLMVALAENMGQAAVGSLVNVYAQNEPERSFRFWYGYQWYADGEYYGGALQKAATAKIAQLARAELGAEPAEASEQPYIGAYRTEDGYYYEHGMAAAVEIIQSRIDSGSNQTVFRALWEFARLGGDPAVRAELVQMVHMATRGVLQLEDLEAVPVRSEGMPVAIMRRVEEACGIDVHDRPSRGFTE